MQKVWREGALGHTPIRERGMQGWAEGDAATTEASAGHTGSTEAGMALQRCFLPKLRIGLWYPHT